MSELTGQERLVRAYVLRGETDEAIAKALDMSASTVRLWRLKWGLPPGGQRRTSGWHWVDRRLAERANDLRMDGWRPERIAKELGVSRRTVYRLLRPELKRGEIRTYSAATRGRLVRYMREKVQPLGAAASRRKGLGRVWRANAE